jgi:hypothetical protein
MIRTSRIKDHELCFFGYNGMYFAKLKRDLVKNTFELVISMTESYFVDRYVSRGIEFANDKYVVCINEDELFYVVDRGLKQTTAKIMWNPPSARCPGSYNFEVFKIPGFNVKKFPFLLMRDDYGLKVFNV